MIPLTFVWFNVQHGSEHPYMQVKVVTGFGSMSYFLLVLTSGFVMLLNIKFVFFIPVRSHIEGLLGSLALSPHSSAWLFLAWPTSGQMIVTALFLMLYWSLKEKWNFSLASLPTKVTAHIQLQKACRHSTYCLETYQQCRLLLLEMVEPEDHGCQDVNLLKFHDWPHGVCGSKVYGLKIRESWK